MIFATALISLSLAACGNNDDNAVDNNNSSTNENGSTTKNKLRPVTEASLSLADARQTFDKTFKSVKLSSIELDESNFKFTYDFEGFDDSKEYKMEIDESNKIVAQEEDPRDNDDDDYQELILDDYIAPDEALSKGAEASETKDLTATSWKLEFDAGVPKYEVKFENEANKEVEVTLDAKTGEQLHIEVDK